MRRRFLIPVLVLAAVLAPASGAAAATFKATLKTPSHQPKAGRGWTITVTATDNTNRPLRAKATYQFLFQGQVVATRYPSPHAPDRKTPYPFRGRFRDPVLFPARSVGIDLTFRVVVQVAGRGSKNLDYAVRVRR